MITSVARDAIENPTCNEEADFGHETAAFLSCTVITNLYFVKFLPA